MLNISAIVAGIVFVALAANAVTMHFEVIAELRERTRIRPLSAILGNPEHRTAQKEIVAQARLRIRESCLHQLPPGESAAAGHLHALPQPLNAIDVNSSQKREETRAYDCESEHRSRRSST